MVKTRDVLSRSVAALPTSGDWDDGWELPDVSLPRLRRGRAEPLARSTQIVWWIGLAGALIATLFVLKEVALVLRALRDILRLAEFTRQAARGVAANLSVLPKLEGLDQPVGALREALTTLVSATTAIERKLSLPVGSSGRRR